MWWSAEARRGFRALLLAIVALCFLSACGYGLESRQPSVMGDNSKKLKLRKVEQPTLYDWLGPAIREEIRDEVNARKLAAWVDNGVSDFSLEVRVRSFTMRSWLRDADDNTVMYDGTMIMEGALYRNEDNAEVWRSGPLAHSETFESGSPEEAAEKLIKRIIQTLVAKMRHSF